MLGIRTWAHRMVGEDGSTVGNLIKQASMIINYNFKVVLTSKLLIFTTLDSYITIVETL